MRNRNKNFNTPSLLIIENKKTTLFVLSKRIIIIENSNNFIKQIKNKDRHAITVLKKYKIFSSKKSFFLINDIKKDFINKIEINNYSASNEMLLAYCLVKDVIDDKTKKIIFSSFSKKNPEYNYIVKSSLKENNQIYINSNLLNKIKSIKKQKYGGKTNIAELFFNNDDVKSKHLISRGGPVVSAERMKPRIKTDYTLHSYSSVYRVPDIRHCHIYESYNTNGYDECKKIALLKSVTEAHERFSSGYIDKSKIIKLETKKLIDNNRIYKYLGISKKKFINGKYICKSPKTKLYSTIEGKILNTKIKWNAPIDLVKFPFSPEKFNRFTFSNSSGVAVGKNYEDACIRALLEYSERHFLTKHWLLQIPFKLIRKNSLPIDIKKGVRSIEKVVKGQIIFGVMGCNIYPHIVAMYINEKSWSAFHLCASVDLDKKRAIKKALNELANTIIFCPTFRKKILLNSEDVISTREHYSFYHNPDNFKFIYNDKLISRKHISWNSILDFKKVKKKLADIELLKLLIAKMSKEFGEVTAFNITAPETTDFGLTVVRIITEKGIPIWFGNADLPLEKKILQINKKKLRQTHIRIHPLG